jgi:hypothetical protein
MERNCSVKDPAKELGWLADDIREMENSGMSQFLYVYQADYKLKTVFIFGNCCPFCSTIIPVHNCSGQFLGYLGNGSGDINPEHLKKIEIIWKPENSACSFQ